MDLEGRTVVVTGVTGSIGGATARAFAQAGARVVLLGRDAQKLAALAAALREQTKAPVVQVRIDLGDMASVRAAAKELRESYPEIHALVHVAALYRQQRVERAGLEEMFATNHLGPFLLTTALEAPLKKGKARVLIVSAPASTRLDFDDLQAKKKFSAFGAFGASKAANLLFAWELARRWKGSGVTVDVIHPGFVKSDLLKEAFVVVRLIGRLISGSPEKPANALLALAQQEGRDGEGRFFKVGKQASPPETSLDRAAQQRLWEESEKLLAAAPGATA